VPVGSDDVTRRDALKVGLRIGAYAAPVVLSTAISTLPAAAVTPIPPTGLQDAVLYGVAADTVIDVLFSLNGTGTPTLLGPIRSDLFGVAGRVIAFPPGTDLNGVTTVVLTYFRNVNGIRSPLPLAPPFTSGLVGLMNGTTPMLLATVLHAPVGCPTPSGTYYEYLDVAIIRGTPSIEYNISVRADTSPAAALGGLLVGPDGNGVGYFPTLDLIPAEPGGAAPMSAVVTAAPLSGGGIAFPPLTVTPAAGMLTNLTCAQVIGGGARAVGVAPR
jgi:hypothetical protein